MGPRSGAGLRRVCRVRRRDAAGPAFRPGRDLGGPRLIGAFGVCVVAGGVFVADPALGFRPGTPSGTPDELSWHGILHGFAPVLAFLSLTVACFVFARRAADLNQRGWAACSVAVGILVQVLGAWATLSGNYVPLCVAIVLGFGWASAQAARLRAQVPAHDGPGLCPD